MTTNKQILGVAVAAALGTTIAPQTASALLPEDPVEVTFDYEGKFTMLDGSGAALANSSIPAKGNNQYQTPVSGTMTFNTLTLSGSGTLVPFDFFSNPPSLPAEAVGINFEIIDPINANGSESLVLGNMLFNWNGNNGIPVSIVLDAEGMFQELPTAMAQYNDITGTLGEPVISGVGATPAADGTYVGASVPGTVTGPGGYAGYLGLGPNPVVTTAWNTTSLCARPGTANDGACMGLSPSGGYPLVEDTVANPNDYTANAGGAIGGNPMIDGPFTGSSANFDVTKLTMTDLKILTSEVPVPAAVWLFGSGLAGLAGMAGRRKTTARAT